MSPPGTKTSLKYEDSTQTDIPLAELNKKTLAYIQTLELLFSPDNEKLTSTARKNQTQIDFINKLNTLCECAQARLTELEPLLTSGQPINESLPEKCQTLHDIMATLAKHFQTLTADNVSTTFNTIKAALTTELAKRWERIKKTNYVYTYQPRTFISLFCDSLASLIDNEKRNSLLMPTVTMTEDIHGSPFNELALGTFIIAEDGVSFIELSEFFRIAYERAKNGTLNVFQYMDAQFEYRDLTDTEKRHIVSVLPSANEFFGLVENIATATVGEGDTPLVALQNLAKALEASDRGHATGELEIEFEHNTDVELLMLIMSAENDDIARKNDLLNHYPRLLNNFKEMHAGNAINTALVEFYLWFNNQPEVIQTQLKALKYGSDSFADILQSLYGDERFNEIEHAQTQGHSLQTLSSGYCTQILDGRTKNIISHNNAALVAMSSNWLSALYDQLSSLAPSIPSDLESMPQTHFWRACREGKLAVVRLLLASNTRINVNAADHDNKLPLRLAAENNHADIVTLLINAGATIENVTRFGKSLFDWALAWRHLNVIFALLSHTNISNTDPHKLAKKIFTSIDPFQPSTAQTEAEKFLLKAIIKQVIESLKKLNKLFTSENLLKLICMNDKKFIAHFCQTFILTNNDENFITHFCQTFILTDEDKKQILKGLSSCSELSSNFKGTLPETWCLHSLKLLIEHCGSAFTTVNRDHFLLQYWDDFRNVLLWLAIQHNDFVPMNALLDQGCFFSFSLPPERCPLTRALDNNDMQSATLLSAHAQESHQTRYYSSTNISPLARIFKHPKLSIEIATNLLNTLHHDSFFSKATFELFVCIRNENIIRACIARIKTLDDKGQALDALAACHASAHCRGIELPNTWYLPAFESLITHCGSAFAAINERRYTQTPNWADFKNRLLCLAIKNKISMSAEALLQQGCCYSVINGYGHCPIIAALESHNVALAKLIWDTSDKDDESVRSHFKNPYSGHERTRSRLCSILENCLSELKRSLSNQNDPDIPDTRRSLILEVFALFYASKPKQSELDMLIKCILTANDKALLSSLCNAFFRKEEDKQRLLLGLYNCGISHSGWSSWWSTHPFDTLPIDMIALLMQHCSSAIAAINRRQSPPEHWTNFRNLLLTLALQHPDFVSIDELFKPACFFYPASSSEKCPLTYALDQNEIDKADLLSHNIKRLTVERCHVSADTLLHLLTHPNTTPNINVRLLQSINPDDVFTGHTLTPFVHTDRTELIQLICEHLLTTDENKKRLLVALTNDYRTPFTAELDLPDKWHLPTFMLLAKQCYPVIQAMNDDRDQPWRFPQFRNLLLSVAIRRDDFIPLNDLLNQGCVFAPVSPPASCPLMRALNENKIEVAESLSAHIAIPRRTFGNDSPINFSTPEHLFNHPRLSLSIRSKLLTVVSELHGFYPVQVFNMIAAIENPTVITEICTQQIKSDRNKADMLHDLKRCWERHHSNSNRTLSLPPKWQWQTIKRLLMHCHSALRTIHDNDFERFLLFHAKEQGDVEYLNFLLENAWYSPSSQNGSFLLVSAIQENKINIARLLLKHELQNPSPPNKEYLENRFISFKHCIENMHTQPIFFDLAMDILTLLPQKNMRKDIRCFLHAYLKKISSSGDIQISDEQLGKLGFLCARLEENNQTTFNAEDWLSSVASLSRLIIDNRDFSSLLPLIARVHHRRTEFPDKITPFMNACLRSYLTHLYYDPPETSILLSLIRAGATLTVATSTLKLHCPGKEDIERLLSLSKLFKIDCDTFNEIKSFSLKKVFSFFASPLKLPALEALDACITQQLQSGNMDPTSLKKALLGEYVHQKKNLEPQHHSKIQQKINALILFLSPLTTHLEQSESASASSITTDTNLPSAENPKNSRSSSASATAHLKQEVDPVGDTPKNTPKKAPVEDIAKKYRIPAAIDRKTRKILAKDMELLFSSPKKKVHFFSQSEQSPQPHALAYTLDRVATDLAMNTHHIQGWWRPRISPKAKLQKELNCRHDLTAKQRKIFEYKITLFSAELAQQKRRNSASVPSTRNNPYTTP